MENHLIQALEIVKAQASVRTMTEEEITSMVQSIANGIRDIEEGNSPPEELTPAIAPEKSIKEKSITCCVCGKQFKILTKKHLATHSLTPDSYREKFEFKKKTPLVCKSLQRERRKRIKENQIWEKAKGRHT